MNCSRLTMLDLKSPDSIISCFPNTCKSERPHNQHLASSVSNPMSCHALMPFCLLSTVYSNGPASQNF